MYQLPWGDTNKYMGYEETNNIHRPRLENVAKGLLDWWEMYTETQPGKDGYGYE